MGYIISMVIGGFVGIFVTGLIYRAETDRRLDELLEEFRYGFKEYEDIYSSVIDPSDKE